MLPMDWGNNCWHQALARIDLPDEFRELRTSMAIARRIKENGSVEDALAALPYMDQVNVLKSRAGDLLIYRWSPRLLDFTMAVNLDGLTAIGPADYYQSYFKPLDAHAAFRPCLKH